MNKIITIYGVTKMNRAMVLGDSDKVRQIDYLTEEGLALSLGHDPKAVAKVRELQIHRIVVDGEDYFVAMEDGLRELLEAPFEARVRDAEERERHTREFAEEAVQRATRRTRQMLAMPWWRRMWFAAFKRNLVG